MNHAQIANRGAQKNYIRISFCALSSIFSIPFFYPTTCHLSTLKALSLPLHTRSRHQARPKLYLALSPSIHRYLPTIYLGTTNILQSNITFAHRHPLRNMCNRYAIDCIYCPFKGETRVACPYIFTERCVVSKVLPHPDGRNYCDWHECVDRALKDAATALVSQVKKGGRK